jgi:hypothetical protein
MRYLFFPYFSYFIFLLFPSIPTHSHHSTYHHSTRSSSMAFRKCSWLALISSFPVLFVIAIVGYGYYTYVWLMCIPLLQAGRHVWSISYLTFWHLLLLVHQVSYWRTVLRDPGSIPEHYILEVCEVDNRYLLVQLLDRWINLWVWPYSICNALARSLCQDGGG